MEPFYTSRSAIECYQNCQRKRYWGYLYGGRGLQPIRKAVPLTTGTAVHLGIEKLFTGSDTEEAVGIAIREYEKIVDKIRGKLNREFLEEEEFIYEEQIALTEGLIRAFAISILPTILGNYEILSVEREESRTLGGDIVLEGKVDSTIKRLDDDSKFVVSLKTTKGLDDKRIDKATQINLQGITELWLAEKRVEEFNEKLRDIEITAKSLADYGDEELSKNLNKIGNWTSSKLQSNFSGVKTIYLIKGERKKQEDGFLETYSPLIRGYRKINEETGVVRYAHSYNYVDEEGRKRKLGKGWESFHVWESEDVGFVKGWIDMLVDGEVQPELGDIITKQFYIPTDNFRSREEIVRTVDEIIQQEVEVKKKAEDGDIQLFSRNRRSCVWPVRCEFWDICWKDGVAENPLECGKYEWRVSHHERERKQHEEQFGKEAVKEKGEELEEVNLEDI